MSAAPFSTSHLDYLRRADVHLAGLSIGGPSTTAPPYLRRLWRVRSIGRANKQLTPSRGRLEHSASADLLIGLSGAEIPMAFFVNGTPSGAAIYIGTWLQPDTVKGRSQFTDLDHSESVLKASMLSLYLAIEMTPAKDEVNRLPLSGLVLGVPTAKPANAYNGALPLDRLIRALSGSTWAAFIQAAPVPEETIISLRDAAINELRVVQAATQVEKVQPPLAKTYTDWLTFTLKALNSSLEVGLWRTGVYLLGDDASYGRLAGVWRAIFSGDKSLPEPIRVLSKPEIVGELAARWILPDIPGIPGPGRYRHPFEYQTLLTSSQLAAYVHLPQLETAGFAISKVGNFDTVQQAVREEGASMRIGMIVPRGRAFDRNALEADAANANYYEVELDALTKHVFIPGVTGAGKTTTIFHLLRQAWASKIPFLVMEPAKTEYRQLRNYPEFEDRLRVFTLGDENCSPIRLNPFELLDGAPLSLHIDLLRSVFTHSFGLWNPLPQILEQCLYLIYEDRGWDVASGVNRRTENRTDPTAFPTLSDLEHKALEVTQRLQWDPEAKARIRGALVDKLSGLRRGARGRMLDTPRSIPMSELMENPTVLELERVGDEDDKAFLMGLLLIRLSEYRRVQENPHDGERRLKHLFVFEEAHRLLANVAAAQRQEETDARGKAVEGFTNLLSEIRAYGQGVIIADQVPTKLAPDVIKNTNLKIAHRIVDAGDRNVLAGSMAMTDQQAAALAILGTGTTLVFREGEDAPLLVHVPPPENAKAPNKTVQQQMAGFRRKYQELFLRHLDCADTGEHGGAACEAARALVETAAFSQHLNRLILSVITDSTAGDRLWSTIQQCVDSFPAADVDRDTMLHCTIARAANYYAARRGSQAGWSYRVTGRFAESIKILLTDLSKKAPTSDASIEDLRRVYLDLSTMNSPYYSRCQKICPSEAAQPARCLYRHAVADVIERDMFTQWWNGSNPFNELKSTETWGVCSMVANVLIENHEHQVSPYRRIGLCYGQMMLAMKGSGFLAPEGQNSVGRIIDALCDESQKKSVKN